MAKWCDFFQVSRSGYYSFLARYESRETEKTKLKSEVKQIFDGSGGMYGLNRICGILRRRGHNVSYGEISGYMAEMGLSDAWWVGKTAKAA